jgi:hypothetical protein
MKQMVNLADRKSGWTAGLALISVSILLIGAGAQAVHFCGIEALSSSVTLELASASSSSGFCLVCVVALSGIILVLLVSFFFSAGAPSSSYVQKILDISTLEQFNLFVRPPPAY